MLTALLAVCVAAPPPAAAPDPEELLRRSAVRTRYDVTTAPGVTTTQSGSGTVVQVTGTRLLVLSCRHVTQHESGRKGRLRVVTCDGLAHEADVLADDADADLSLIEARLKRPGKALAARVAAGEAYRPGLEVVKVGFPGGGRRVVARGAVRDFTNHHVAKPGVVSTVATAQSASGDSGGGLFRASDHALVGVVWGGLPDGLRASRLRDIHALLARAKVKLD